MSISSDVYITRKEAKKRVLASMLYEQKRLIDKAVNAMEDFELSSYLNRDSDLYYYNIETDEK